MAKKRRNLVLPVRTVKCPQTVATAQQSWRGGNHFNLLWEDSTYTTTFVIPPAGGYPVRRELSLPSLPSLECWIVRPSAQLRTRPTMTAVIVLAALYRRSFARKPCPRNQRAQGRPGARCTRGLMCDRCNKMLHMSIQVQRRTPGLPCAMALRLIRNRPGDRLSCHHRPLEALASHELDASTGASDPNDFTVRISPFVSRADASTATCPTSATTADAPWWDRIAGFRLLICPTGQQEYFCAKGWTDFCATAVICPSGYFVAGIYRCARTQSSAWRGE